MRASLPVGGATNDARARRSGACHRRRPMGGDRSDHEGMSTGRTHGRRPHPALVGEGGSLEVQFGWRGRRRLSQRRQVGRMTPTGSSTACLRRATAPRETHRRARIRTVARATMHLPRARRAVPARSGSQSLNSRSQPAEPTLLCDVPLPIAPATAASWSERFATSLSSQAGAGVASASRNTNRSVSASLAPRLRARPGNVLSGRDLTSTAGHRRLMTSGVPSAEESTTTISAPAASACGTTASSTAGIVAPAWYAGMMMRILGMGSPAAKRLP